MKLKSFFLMLCMAFYLTISVNAQNERKITVEGDAEINVLPDFAVITLTISSQEKDIDDSKLRFDEKSKKFMELFKQFDISNKDIKPGLYNVSPVYDNMNQNNIIGYRINKTVSVTLLKIESYESFLSGLIKADIIHINGISFQNSKISDYKNDARIMAIQAAKSKAELIAGSLHQKIGKPLDIIVDNDLVNSLFQNPYSNVIRSNLSGAEESSPGKITIKASVRVVFELTE